MSPNELCIQHFVWEFIEIRWDRTIMTFYFFSKISQVFLLPLCHTLLIPIFVIPYKRLSQSNISRTSVELQKKTSTFLILCILSLSVNVSFMIWSMKYLQVQGVGDDVSVCVLNLLPSISTLPCLLVINLAIMEI